MNQNISEETRTVGAGLLHAYSLILFKQSKYTTSSCLMQNRLTDTCLCVIRKVYKVLWYNNYKIPYSSTLGS